MARPKIRPSRTNISAPPIEPAPACSKGRRSWIGTSSPRSIVMPRSVGGASGTGCTAGVSITSATADSSTANRSLPTRKTRSRATPSRNMAHRLQQLDDRVADVAEWQHPVGAGVLKRRLRHAEDRRRLAILDNGAAARAANGTRSLGAVAAHAGEHHGHGRWTEQRCRRAKEMVGGGADAPQWRSIIERDFGAPFAVANRHVPAAGRDVDATVHDRLAVLRLFGAHRTHRVEPLGKAPREAGRHVLDDEHRGPER